MEYLHTGGIVGVRAVGMGAEFKIGVRRVGLRQVGLEIPEAAKDCFTDIGHAFDQLMGGVEGGRGVGGDAEPVAGDGGQPLLDAVVGVHDLLVGHRRCLAVEDGGVPPVRGDVESGSLDCRFAKLGQKPDRQD